jgi:hypothetical protein
VKIFAGFDYSHFIWKSDLTLVTCLKSSKLDNFSSGFDLESVKNAVGWSNTECHAVICQGIVIFCSDWSEACHMMYGWLPYGLMYHTGFVKFVHHPELLITRKWICFCLHVMWGRHALYWVPQTGLTSITTVCPLRFGSLYVKFFTFGCCILLHIYPTGSLWCRQSQQSFNTLTPYYFLSHSLYVSAPMGHLQVRYTIRYF